MCSTDSFGGLPLVCGVQNSSADTGSLSELYLQAPPSKRIGRRSRRYTKEFRPCLTLCARLGGRFGSMLAKPAKVNDTPALGDQLDLLLQPMYTQSYTRQNKERSSWRATKRQEVSELRLYFHQSDEPSTTMVLLS